MVSQRQLLLLVSAFLASPSSAFQPHVANPYLSQLSYRPTEDVPEATLAPAFEQNVRNLVIQQEDPTQVANAGLPNMMNLSTRQEFHDHVLSNTYSMTVVRFHAPFCRACKAMQPAWERMARQHPEINFVNVAYNKQDVETRALISQLGINKVPFGQVYHPSYGLVESANLNKKHFSNVVKHIEWYVQGLCGLEAEVDEYSHVYESPYMNLAI